MLRKQLKICFNVLLKTGTDTSCWLMFKPNILILFFNKTWTYSMFLSLFFLQSVYSKLLPLYFPRSDKEEKVCLPLIPADIGNSEGEPVVPERQIRITEKPGSLEGTHLFLSRQIMWCIFMSALFLQDNIRFFFLGLKLNTSWLD